MFIEGGNGPERDIFSTESLIDWLEQKPGDVGYDYQRTYSCLLAQYFSDMGMVNVEVSPEYISYSYINKGSTCRLTHHISDEWFEIASSVVPNTIFLDRYVGHSVSAKWTYGQALLRAKKFAKVQDKVLETA